MEQKNRKKILYVITKSNWGGAQKYVYELATSLPKEDFDVAVVLGGSGELSQKLVEAHIRVIPLQTLGRDIDAKNDASAFSRLLSIFKQEQPDIVHLNSSKAGALGALAGRIAGVKKIIFTGHGWAFNENRSLFFKSFARLSHWMTILLSHKVVVVSEYMKRQVVNWPFVSKKITVIHNGVEQKDFLTREISRQKLSEKIAERYGNQDKSMEKNLWIGTISELHQNKGLSFLLQSIAELKKKELPPFVCVIIGEGEKRKSLEAECKNLGFEDTVFFVGHVKNAAEYLQAFDIFTLTSITEGLSYAITEAGSAGVPVLASSIGGIPEIITSAEMGTLVPVGDVSAITAGLATLLTDKNMRQSLGEALKKRIEQEFSFEKMLEKTIALYR